MPCFRRALKRSRFRKRARKVVRRHVKRARLGRRRNSVRLGQGFPKKIFMVHKFQNVYTLTSTTGALTTQQMSCNGMFQPDPSGTTHQPFYYDQMSALYDHYTVVGSKCVWKVTQNATLTNPGYVACFINDDTVTTPSSITNIAELPTGRMRQLPILKNSSVTFVQKWSAKKYIGGSVLGNPNLQGLGGNASGVGGSNPSEQAFFELAYQNITSTGVISVECSVTYAAVWREIKDIAQS